MPQEAVRPRERLEPTLADWIDLLAVQHRDEGHPDAHLRRRDRAIGRELAARGLRPEEKIVGWVRATRRIDRRGAKEPPGPGTAEAVGLAATVLAGAGLLLGGAAALGAYGFRPEGRINAVAVVGTLVGIPGVLLLFAVLNALPTPLRRVLPWVGREPEGGGLQPARLALRLLPAKPRATLEHAWGRGRGLERLTAPLRRWLLLSGSQGAAVAFQLGALGTAIALVIFSDLSFGWSTTLEVSPRAVHRVTSALSLPWARLWPAAQPSLELLEQTRFFRIAAAPDPSLPPVAYGGWWPFLVMCQAVYGLLPRLVFLAVARAGLRRALRRAMREAPGARRVLDRLEAPLVETAHPERERGERAGAAEETPAAADVPLPGRAVLVVWAEALGTWSPAELFGAGLVGVHEAGGRRGFEEDAEALRRAAGEAAEAEAPVLFAVRGFEPPLAETLDALATLREALGDGPEILVAPVGGEPDDHAAWRRRLAHRGDPWLALARPPKPSAPAPQASAAPGEPGP